MNRALLLLLLRWLTTAAGVASMVAVGFILVTSSPVWPIGSVMWLLAVLTLDDFRIAWEEYLCETEEEFEQEIREGWE